MITNLLFDLGGVIMDLDRHRCCRAFEKLGMTDISEFLGEYAQKGPFAQLESGDITPDEFRAIVRRHIPRPVSDSEMDSAFCEFLLGIPPERLHQLEQLRRRFKVYMLSNTNRIMWDSKIDAEFRKEGFDMHHYFDGIVTSFEARCMKPAEGIFRYAEQKLGIEPSATLFLDDSEANVEAARALGFHAALVAPGEEFSHIIASYLRSED